MHPDGSVANFQRREGGGQDFSQLRLKVNWRETSAVPSPPVKRAPISHCESVEAKILATGTVAGIPVAAGTG